MPFTVYVLRNPGGWLYIGQTSSLPERLAAHEAGESRWTVPRGPRQLVYTEEFETRAAAMRREKPLKSGRQNQELRRMLEEQRGR